MPTGFGVTLVDANRESLRSLHGGSDHAVPNADFVALLATCQRPIFLYAMSLLGNVDDAEEVVQESGLVLWKKFHEYQPGTDFIRWACQIARYQSLKVRARRFRGPQSFSNEFLAMVAAAAEEKSQAELESRQKALQQCMQELRAADQDLIARRYRKNSSTREVAETLHRSVQGTRRSLQRIREVLGKCVRSKIAIEEEE
jgi:RNA polymerase sigma-70 factor (ECF subfamily)